MYSLFTIFLPSVLGLKIIDHLNPKLKIKDLIIYYFLLVLISNILCIGVDLLLNNFEESLVIYISEHLGFAFKYLLFSTVVNFFLGFAFSILIKNFSISLEVKNETKNRKSN